jgi:hypothetical protein
MVTVSPVSLILTRARVQYLPRSVKINEVCVKVTVSLILTVVYSTCIYPALLKSMRFI